MRDEQAEIYMAFRRELDSIWVPQIMCEFSTINVIEHNGEIAGIICGNEYYIDCVYIKPEYRRKGLASTAVKEYVRENGAIGTRLHILNNNYAALRFWNGLFELDKIEENSVDTLYEIIGVKYEQQRT